jgi:FKBP-type peptidyl-prolyl cis-trans isomerase
MFRVRSLWMIALVLTIATLSSVEGLGQNKRRRSASRRASKTTSQPALPGAAMLAKTTRTGLTYLITQRGSGRQPKAGEIIVVHYTGTLTNGVKFDSSRDRGEPFAFKLGAAQVIKGWDEGFAQLRVGDRAILVIPSQLGYGIRGAGNVIPPNATLVFIVELLDIKTTSLSDTLSKTLDAKGVEAMLAQYRELKSAGKQDIYSSESDLNGWGYRLLARKRMREAIEVFKLNVEAYPQSANVYDSLAEAYLNNGDKKLAIENYHKALDLNPQMESARNALKELTGK